MKSEDFKERLKFNQELYSYQILIKLTMSLLRHQIQEENLKSNIFIS